MSVIIMGLVWEANLPQREKLILLAYADHADHEGNNVYPSIGLIAWKTGYKERAVQRITKSLVAKGIMILGGSSRYGTNLYKIDISKLPKLSPYGRGVRLTPGTYGGDSLTSGVKITPVELTPGVTAMTPGGVSNMQGGGVIAVTPDPSFNHHINHHLTDQSPEEKHKARTREAIVRGEAAQISLEDRFYQCFHINVSWNSKSGKLFCQWLKERPPDQTVEKFAEWWKTQDWRGRSGQPPTIYQIQELWPQAFIPVQDSPASIASEVY